VLLNIAILTAVLATAVLLLSPRLMKSQRWRAMITPLASIIGSGFLVLGPLLDASYGKFAPLVMGGLCIGAYLFGAAIRFNIVRIDSSDYQRSTTETHLETAASWALAFAYVISVAYYLNLFGAFGVSLSGANDDMHAKLLTTAVFCVILFVGWTRGFKMLERMEYLSVTAKLAIIAGLMVGLAAFFVGKVQDDTLIFNPAVQTGWTGLTLAFGLLVTVQGFETSRYLGRHYDAETRVRSMKLAQWVSTAIYMVYIGLLSYVFQSGELMLTETAIVDMMKIVAPILPGLLVAAALSAQFSAAVADTSGSGGLFSELTDNRINARRAYALLVAIGLVLTWSVNIFQIISYASQAFAVYYGLQALIAGISAFRAGKSRTYGVLFLLLALLAVAIVIFGQPVEV